MNVLITGANGMVARAAIKYCGELGDNVTGLTRQQLDISDRDAVFQVFESIHPDAVLNCAAYTNVDGAETYSKECDADNMTGIVNVAAESKVFNSVFVTISTDYIFDGEKDGFYTEDDIPAPQSVYAKSKLDGEVSAAKANPNSIIVRSGWIYGAHGTNFLSIMDRLLAERKRIKAISDSYGTPTYAHDLAVRMRELTVLKAGGIFHVTNAGAGVSYLQFAAAVAEIGGFDTALIEAVSKDALQRPAPRPTNSRLASVRADLPPMRDWRDALVEYISEK